MLQYARAHSTTPSEIRKIVEEITAHWTIGPGAGTRRRNWLATVRRRLHELAQRGEIRPVTGKPSVPPEEYARREAAYQAEMVERRKRRRAENEAWLAEHAPDSEAIVRDALAGGSLL